MGLTGGTPRRPRLGLVGRAAPSCWQTDRHPRMQTGSSPAPRCPETRTSRTQPTSCNGRVRGSTAALPGRAGLRRSIEHGGELRGHTCGVAEAEACGRVAGVG